MKGGVIRTFQIQSHLTNIKQKEWWSIRIKLCQPSITKKMLHFKNLSRVLNSFLNNNRDQILKPLFDSALPLVSWLFFSIIAKVHKCTVYTYSWNFFTIHLLHYWLLTTVALGRTTWHNSCKVLSKKPSMGKHSISVS